MRSVTVRGGSKIHRLLDLMCCKMLLMSKPCGNAVLMFLISSPFGDSLRLFTSKSVPFVPLLVNLAVSTTCKQPCTWVPLLLARSPQGLMRALISCMLCSLQCKKLPHWSCLKQMSAYIWTLCDELNIPKTLLASLARQQSLMQEIM